jgi:hypothetical protein
MIRRRPALLIGGLLRPIAEIPATSSLWLEHADLNGDIFSATASLQIEAP